MGKLEILKIPEAKHAPDEKTITSAGFLVMFEKLIECRPEAAENIARNFLEKEKGFEDSDYVEGSPSKTLCIIMRERIKKEALTTPPDGKNLN